MDDDGGEQVEAGHAVVPALDGAVADFALTPDPECVLEGVTSLALVQAGVGPVLHVGVEQPVDKEANRQECLTREVSVSGWVETGFTSV